MRAWRYGLLHAHYAPHLPFSKSGLLGPLYDRSFPGKGNQRTVHVSTPDEADETFRGQNGANLKIIHSLNARDKSFWISDSGNSESLFSPNYDDQHEIYARDGYLELVRNTTLLLQGKHRLVLRRRQGGSSSEL